MFNDEGIDYITVHARTKLQMYKGVAEWNYISQAVQESKVPIIGNGDVWTLSDIDRLFKNLWLPCCNECQGSIKNTVAIPNVPKIS